MPTIAPYGSWASPIDAELVAAAQIDVMHPWLDGADAYWCETRPNERGRLTLMRRNATGETEELTPEPFGVRSSVTEYGGVSYTARSDVVLAVNFADQRVYRLRPGDAPAALTPESSARLRFIDLDIDPVRERAVAICEDHTAMGEAVHRLVSIRLDGEATLPLTLVTGPDFLSYPRVSPDGRKLAWLAWNHPDMPWDATELWVGDLDDAGLVSEARKIAGGEGESILQPAWAPDGRLYFISDRTQWWNLYVFDGASIRAICPMQAEFAGAAWTLGMRWYAPLGNDRIVAAYSEQALWYLAVIDVATGDRQEIDLPHVHLVDPVLAGDRLLIRAARTDRSGEILEIDLAGGAVATLRDGGELPFGPEHLSLPETITFKSAGGRDAHAFFYPPTNPDFQAPAGELPPLVVRSHGGPTSCTNAGLRLGFQYWTSRGYGVVDVNYGGSYGYGRPYRQSLNDAWGIVDVEDCTAAALHLAEAGRADVKRLAITGGSAGGYTTLCALTFEKTFAVGASHYGIGDLAILARETHKFESRYLDRLIGRLPEDEALYVARSPIHHVANMTTPCIFFQGLEDKVVPPNQAQMMVDALRANGVPVAYLTFAGEGHGFRRAEVVKKVIVTEYAFFCRILGITPGEALPDVPIDNL